jgi:hypothetical protein
MVYLHLHPKKITSETVFYVRIQILQLRSGLDWFRIRNLYRYADGTRCLMFVLKNFERFKPNTSAPLLQGKIYLVFQCVPVHAISDTLTNFLAH